MFRKTALTFAALVAVAHPALAAEGSSTAYLLTYGYLMDGTPLKRSIDMHPDGSAVISLAHCAPFKGDMSDLSPTLKVNGPATRRRVRCDRGVDGQGTKETVTHEQTAKLTRSGKTVSFAVKQTSVEESVKPGGKPSRVSRVLEIGGRIEWDGK